MLPRKAGYAAVPEFSKSGSPKKDLRAFVAETRRAGRSAAFRRGGGGGSARDGADERASRPSVPRVGKMLREGEVAMALFWPISTPASSSRVRSHSSS